MPTEDVTIGRFRIGCSHMMNKIQIYKKILKNITFQFVFHNSHKLFVTKGTIPILVKYGKNNINNVFWQIDIGTNFGHMLESFGVYWSSSQIVKVQSLKMIETVLKVWTFY